MARFSRATHEDELPLVDHLDEMRSRILVIGAGVLLAFAFCFWQNGAIIELLNAPLPEGKEPITLGVTEPFMTTIMVSGYAAILLSLPVILHQLYSFVLPAFSPTERKLALPMMLAVPFLLLAGIAFAYLVVLPAAVNFLLNFNANDFNIEIRARDYYGFVAQTVIAVGLTFQIPVAILAATRLGITTPEQLRRNRRYAILIIAVAAMALPGTDPVTMLIEMVPLVALFEISIVLAALLGNAGAKPAGAEAG